MSNKRKTEEKIRSHLYTLMSDLLVENDYGKVLNFFIGLLSPELSQKVYNGSIAVVEHSLKLSYNSVEIP